MPFRMSRTHKVVKENLAGFVTLIHACAPCAIGTGAFCVQAPEGVGSCVGVVVGVLVGVAEGVAVGVGVFSGFITNGMYTNTVGVTPCACVLGLVVMSDVVARSANVTRMTARCR